MLSALDDIRQFSPMVLLRVDTGGVVGTCVEQNLCLSETVSSDCTYDGSFFCIVDVFLHTFEVQTDCLLVKISEEIERDLGTPLADLTCNAAP
jgi:hypothetical protein